MDWWLREPVVGERPRARVAVRLAVCRADSGVTRRAGLVTGPPGDRLSSRVAGVALVPVADRGLAELPAQVDEPAAHLAREVDEPQAGVADADAEVIELALEALDLGRDRLHLALERGARGVGVRRAVGQLARGGELQLAHLLA